MAEALADLPAWRAAATGDPRADWPALWRLSVNGPEAFWPRALAALRVRWAAPPERTLADAGGDPDAVRWLPGARLNLAESALRGGRGAPDGARTAVLWADEAAPRAVRAVSLAELAQRAQHVADALAAAGLRPGDAVAIAMPLTPAAVAVFLGVVLAGCAAVSIAESFAPAEIAARLRVSRARLVFTQDVVPRSGRALPLHARIAAAPGAPRAVVVPASAADAWPLAAEPACALRPGGADEPLARFLARAPAPPLGAPPRGIDRDAYDLSGVLFSSGTTGEPKAIPWTHVTPLRCAVDAYFHQDLRPGDVACWPTSLGWMMGACFCGWLGGGVVVGRLGASALWIK
jgi:acetyl-CoA synthetase